MTQDYLFKINNQHASTKMIDELFSIWCNVMFKPITLTFCLFEQIDKKHVIQLDYAQIGSETSSENKTGPFFFFHVAIFCYRLFCKVECSHFNPFPHIDTFRRL